MERGDYRLGNLMYVKVFDQTYVPFDTHPEASPLCDVVFSRRVKILQYAQILCLYGMSSQL